MARTLDEIRASRPKFDRAQIDATTEGDIRRHMIEDGEDPDAPLPVFVKRRPGQRGPSAKPAKVQIALRVDPDTLAAFRATGEGWQTRMNDVLTREARRLRKAG